MTVLNAETTGYSPKAISLWEEKGFSYKPSSWEEIQQTASFPGVTALIVRLQKKVDEQVLAKFPDLKLLISATTGHDHLDLNALQRRNIRLVSLRGQDAFLQTIPSTAELSFGLLLSLIRNIPAANESVKNGVWNRDLFRGYQLKNKTLGIIGMGRTGKKMAEYATAFGMNIVYVDPYVYLTGYEKLPDIPSLLRISDVVSIHVHLLPETTGLLNRENLSQTKKGAFLINTSRGDVWKEEEVARLLREKKISGVGADVLSGELANIRKSELWKAQQEGLNVIITPHLGGATYDAMWACEEFIVSLV